MSNEFLLRHNANQDLDEWHGIGPHWKDVKENCLERNSLRGEKFNEKGLLWIDHVKKGVEGEFEKEGKGKGGGFLVGRFVLSIVVFGIVIIHVVVDDEEGLFRCHVEDALRILLVGEEHDRASTTM